VRGAQGSPGADGEKLLTGAFRVNQTYKRTLSFLALFKEFTFCFLDEFATETQASALRGTVTPFRHLFLRPFFPSFRLKLEILVPGYRR